MSRLRAVLAVLEFESRRAITVPRLIVLAGLMVFPAALMALISRTGGPIHYKEFWAAAAFFLIPEVACLLALLLWATPVIQAEIEGKTWQFLAVRPAGKVSILLGKYLAAVVWAVAAGWGALGLSLCVVLPRTDIARAGLPMNPQAAAAAPTTLSANEVAQGVLVLSALVFLGCLAYGALFVLLGTVFPRRGMIVAVMYTFFIEFLVGSIPAIVSHFTVQYRLRSILVKWMNMEAGPERIRQWVGTGNPWQHILFLLAATVGLLVIAGWILRTRELVIAPEV